MSSNDRSFGSVGIFLLVVAALLLGGMGVVVAGGIPSQVLTRVVMPIVALALGIAALFAGHVSYPRVQNLRVYLAGYSVGLQSIAYALLAGTAPWIGGDLIPAPPVGFAYIVFTLAIVLSLAYTVVTPFPTYRVTRFTTWILLGVQVVVLVIARFVPGTAAWVRALVPPDLVSWHSLAVLVATVSIIVTNAVVKPQSFYLRGAISGLALLAGGTWILPGLLQELGYGLISTTFLAQLYASVVPLFLIISILAHVLARMEHRVSYDPLLQIYNRQYANQVLGEQSSVSTRPPFTVMMIDIDHFKKVNDTYGHQAGDRILFSVAQEVQKAVVPEGIVCRYGGEELIVFVPGRNARDVVPLAQRLRAGIEEMETVFRAKRIAVTVSIGLSDRYNPKHPLTHIVHAADKALYIAKENGRNQVRLVRIRE